LGVKLDEKSIAKQNEKTTLRLAAVAVNEDVLLLICPEM